MRRKLSWTIGLTAAVAALLLTIHPTIALAHFRHRFLPTTNGVPEIGADAIGGAIAMVAGGLAVLRDRMRRR